jgi:hypothetical protein
LISDDAITQMIACNLVKPDSATHCLGNNLPPGQGQACALMFHQRFA